MEPSKQPAVAKTLPNRDVQNLNSGICKLKKMVSQKETTNTIAMKNKIKKIKELPDEIWLKVMKYCSTSDILRKMAPVSKRFYRLSQDRNLIKRIEFKGIKELTLHGPWVEKRKEKYYNDFSKVLKNAQNLKSLSLHGEYQSMRKFYKNIPLRLEEFCIEFRNVKLDAYMDFLDNGAFKLSKAVLDQCLKLEILKVEIFNSEINLILKTMASFHSESLRQLYLNFNEDTFLGNVTNQSLECFLNKMIENFPKIEYIGLALDFDLDIFVEETKTKKMDFNLDIFFEVSNYKTVCQKIARENNIEIEIRNTTTGSKLIFG